MPRHILFGLIFLALISLVGVSYYYDLQKRIHELVRPGAEPAPYLAIPPAVSLSAPLRKVKLFFPSSKQDSILEVEERDIRSSELPSEEAKQIVSELINGSLRGRLPALPRSGSKASGSREPRIATVIWHAPAGTLGGKS